MKIITKNYFVLFFCLLLVTHPLQAQNNENKITLALYHRLNNAQQKPADFKIPVLIQGDAAQIKQFIEQQNEKIKFTAGNIISATISKQLITELNAQEFVKQIDGPKGKLVPLNDVMVIQNNVDSATSGYWPLSQGYDGTGVVIGIIDAPFDYKHGDFTDDAGNTRIKFLWDQNLPADASAPEPYGYGIECDSASMANGTCPHTDDVSYYSHGTGVAGVAASSGNATGKYRGVAPNADLIFVSLNFYGDFLTNTTDAIKYIFDKADALGKPCVINTSFGDYTGSHDGKDLTSQIIDSLITEKNGRAVVAAAGNAGNAAIHLKYNVTATPQFTWFKKLSYADIIYTQIWANEATFNNVYFSFAADDPTGFIYKGSTPYYNILNDYNVTEEGDIDSTDFNLYQDDTVFIGDVKTYVQKINGSYMMEMYIIPANPDYYWRFTTYGSGSFDCWSTEAYTGFSDYVTTGLPYAETLPDIVNYQSPNTDQTIVSGWQCSDKVIAVGSYTNRDTMTNYYGVMPSLTDPVGELFPSSSHGPTRDGRTKPDITATGARVLTTGSSILTDWLIGLGAADYISQDGQHYLQNGTSFASPVVTGIAALYFQKNPEANYADVKNALITNAKQDEFTGDALPDNEWGYGKANAFRTLTGPWGCSADDYQNPPQNLEVSIMSPTAASIKWDIIPNADSYQILYKKLTDVSFLKKTTANNHKILNLLLPSTTYACKVRAFCDGYGKSNMSDFIYFTTPPLREGSYAQNSISVYPNPASNILFIDGLQNENYEMNIFNSIGQNMQTRNLIVDSDPAQIDISDLPQGIYYIDIRNESTYFTKQIIVK